MSLDTSLLLVLYLLKKRLKHTRELRERFLNQYSPNIPPSVQEEINKLNNLIESIQLQLKSFQSK